MFIRDGMHKNGAERINGDIARMGMSVNWERNFSLVE